MKRNRKIYFVLIFFIILIGLLSRKYQHFFPEGIGEYPGDFFYAMMIYVMVGFLFPTASIMKVGVLTIIFCFSIEISQLIHTPIFNEIRKTVIGRLILGYGFQLNDLIAYLLSVIFCLSFEKLHYKKKVIT